MPNEIYMKRENRDQRARELKADGYSVKRRSERNQQLHPMYVEDWPGDLSDADKGFGNTVYKTMFGNLYVVEWSRGGQ